MAILARPCWGWSIERHSLRRWIVALESDSSAHQSRHAAAEQIDGSGSA
jgi:hypothetical protein